MSKFQSTLPRGSDRFLPGSQYIREYFNPRSLAGATKKCGVKVVSVRISIHAPSRERRSCHSRQRTRKQFQSTLPRGSDKIGCLTRSCRTNFNPRSLAGATAATRLRLGRMQYFNPRSLAGATRERHPAGECVKISIHAPSRERHKRC